MISKILNKWFSANKDSGSLAIVAEQEDIPRYPPFAKGLPAADTRRILDSQSELILRIRGILRFTPEEFRETVNPVIENYAAYVHLLPASETHHHRGAGGLFRHGLEVGFWAAQQAEAHQFCIDETPRNKRDNEPRWQFAAFLGGLLHDVGKPLSDVAVTNKDGTKEWNPYECSLAAWAIVEDVDHYFLRWRDKRNKRHEKFSMMNLDQIITQKAKTYLNKPGPNIMESLLESIVGTSAQETLTQLVLWADQESVRRDLVNQRMDVDEFSYGVPVERFVFDALRRLGNISKVNEPGAMIWRTEHGVFLAWKSIVNEVHNLIDKDKIPGIPRNHDTLADILVERGFAIPYQETTESKPSRYWNIYPDCLEGVGLTCLRIDDIELIFPNEPPPPAKASLNKPQKEKVVKEESNVVSIDKKVVEQSHSKVEPDDNPNMPDMNDIEEYMNYSHKHSTLSEAPINHGELDENQINVTDKPNLNGNKTEKNSEKTSIAKLAAVATEVEIEVGEVLPETKIKKLSKNINNENQSHNKDEKLIEKEETITDKKQNHITDDLRQGPAWEVINKAIEITRIGKKKPILIKLNDANYGIPYPNAARSLGEPRDIMNILSDDKLLSISPIAAAKTTTINGEKYLVLDTKATNYINGKLSNIETDRSKDRLEKGRVVNNKNQNKKNNTKKDQNKFDEDKFRNEFIEQLTAGFGCYIEGDVMVNEIDGKVQYTIAAKPTLEKISDYHNWPGYVTAKIYINKIEGLNVTKKAITFTEPSS